MLFLAYSVIRAALINREGAVFVFGGFAALAAAGAWDMAIETYLVREPHLMPIGVLVFALLQALHMSQRFVRNLRKVETLSAELDAKNIALELKMAETEHLSRQIVSISEEERCQISQDLHDGMCQLLTAARLRFSVLKKKLLLGEPGEDELEKSSQLLETAVNQAYDMSLGLWPVETGTGRLATSFEELCRRTARSNNIEVAFHSNLPLCPKQSPEVTRQLYRIAQEALTNVAKHSGANHASVAVFCSQGCGMRLTVEDDGVGRARSKSGGSGGLGTRIMQHRAVVIGGELSISDRPGGGTVVSCIVSCPGARASDCPSHAEKPHA
jgi:signal transduction histidine kinase